MTYKDLCDAIAILGLPEQASLTEIREIHRALVKEHHPDSNADGDPELIRKVNDAYAVLRAYCDNYRFSFDHDTFLLQSPEERIREQFYSDPIWGGDDSGQ